MFNKQMTIDFDAKTIMINVNKQKVMLPFDLLHSIAWGLSMDKEYSVMVIDPDKVRRIGDSIVVLDSPDPMSYSIKFIQQTYDKWLIDKKALMKEFNE